MPDRQHYSAIKQVLLFFIFFIASTGNGHAGDFSSAVTAIINAHPGLSGAYVLEKGEESLLARGWLAGQAETGIEVQYFIWSTDNIGTLAAEALLSAAERGVAVRVLVDDLLIDADNDVLLALAAHPNAHIRIYNPRHSVGTSTLNRIINILTDFRGVNQRMHDKSFVVDGRIAIIGGRNMADEYFDYDHLYNFRDRDVLLIGPVATDIKANFELFWESDLSVPVEKLLEKQRRQLSQQRITEVYKNLHAYAQNPQNYEPQVRRMVDDIPQRIPGLLNDLVWEDIRFICDAPGKNPGNKGLGGGGATTDQLMTLIKQARRRVTIQSPYLVMPEGGFALFRSLTAKGVKVRISTNSLASTDNVQAFSGYSKQRQKLLDTGIEISEFRPDSIRKKQLIDRYQRLEKLSPDFSIHAKTMVIDGETLCIGTFNFDPRSANLNTEIGVIIKNKKIARQVEQQIRIDMQPGNSWNAQDIPDSQASLKKRLMLNFWKLLPLKPLL